MRKTSVFARKRAAGQAQRTNPNATSLVIQKCSPFSDEKGTLKIANSAMLRIREGLDSLRHGSAVDNGPYDLVVHAVNISYVRALQIGGVHNNPMLPVLSAAEHALGRCLDRFHRTGQWGLDGPAISELTEALELYEQIVTMSSPQQMEHAVEVKNAIQKKQEQRKLAEMASA